MNQPFRLLLNSVAEKHYPSKFISEFGSAALAMDTADHILMGTNGHSRDIDQQVSRAYPRSSQQTCQPHLMAL
jgi:hypothetical protein